jgi:hypothetical protein
MARTYKEGKRGWRQVPLGAGRGVGFAIEKRHTWGSTEKILRRNRRLWERLAAKRRRAVDKRVIVAELVF